MPDHLLEISPFPNDEGQRVGRDPRKLVPSDFPRSQRRKNPLKAIRAKCLDCCCGQPQEVRKCMAIDCDLWPFRMGTNPFREKQQLSPERLAHLRKAREVAS